MKKFIKYIKITDFELEKEFKIHQPKMIIFRHNGEIMFYM